MYIIPNSFLCRDAETQSAYQYSERALKLLNKRAGMSNLLLSLMYQDNDGIGRFGNGCFVNSSRSSRDTTFGVYTCFYLPKINDEGFVDTEPTNSPEMIYYHCEPDFKHTLVNMRSTGSSTTYFIVNPMPNIFTRFEAQLKNSPQAASRLFYPDILIADEVLKAFSDVAAEKWEQLGELVSHSITLSIYFFHILFKIKDAYKSSPLCWATF